MATLSGKRKETERFDLNRKVVAWVFVITGLISVLAWWKGRSDRGGEFNLLPKGNIFTSTYVETNKTPIPENKSKKAEKLISELQTLVATTSGTWSVQVNDLNKTGTYGFNQMDLLSGASIMKVPVMITALKKVEEGSMSLADELELKEIDRTPGSGPLQFMKAGTRLSLDRVLTELGKKSDNTAWVMLNRILGMQTIATTMKSMGMTDSDYAQYKTTAADVAKMWSVIYKNEYLTLSSRDKMWEYLSDSIYEDRLSKGITDTNLLIVHKVGTLADVWADGGVVSCKVAVADCNIDPFVVVIMNEGIVRAEAESMVPELARRIWQFEVSETKP